LWKYSLDTLRNRVLKGKAKRTYQRVTDILTGWEVDITASGTHMVESKIGVIGAGMMGLGIAQIFAVAGHQVRLMDVSEVTVSSAPQRIRNTLLSLVKHGLCNGEEIEPIVGRISPTTSMQQAVSEADFVFEAVFEDMGVKQGTFNVLDSLCSRKTILATNTSVMSISEIASTSEHRDRIVGTHFWNPPYLIPLVEVVKARDTSDDVVEATYDLLKSVGKHPVRVRKDVPGFVANRMQHALWREAISIVENGIADAATVDECVRYSFGLRLPVLGPMENADLVGTDLTLAIHSYILRHLENSPEPSPLLRAAVAQNELGFKTGKGFQTWSPGAIQDCRERLMEHLARVVRDMEQE
jgi:3-hydroxybutyryl-CoA dehydrogenase